jgi:predicted nucleotidyltransferase component of viral defense system
MFHLTTVEPETYRLLEYLFTLPFIKKDFALAGGTSLSLQIGHRKSIDLDIFSPSEFSVQELESELRSVKEWNVEITGKNKKMLFTRVNNIKCDFVHEPAPVLKEFVSFEGSSLFSIEDIAAMKLHTICGRGKRKDFFDIYSLLQLFSWNELLSFFEKKYTTSQLYFLWRSIIYFEDAEDDFEIEGLGQFNVSWKHIKEVIQATCINK